MRRKTMLVIIALATLFTVTAWQAASAQEENDIEKPAATPVEGGIDWVFDYDQAQFLARSSGKPMFVVFRCER